MVAKLKLKGIDGKAPSGVEPAVYFDSTWDTSPGPDTERIDRLIALSQFCSHGKMGADSSVTPKLKLKWKSTKHDKTNGGYSYSLLVNLLHKYGDVLNVIISNKKNGSAIVEFATLKAATLAFKNERGLVDNPLKISWLEGQVTSEEAISTKSGQFIHGTNQPKQQAACHTIPPPPQNGQEVLPVPDLIDYLGVNYQEL
ncbi:DJC17 protein, partial [Polypterus senegalus]